MPSVKFSLVAAATALFSVVRADYYVEPSSVPLGTRKSWCTNEISTCPLICQQNPPYSTSINTCDATTLTYGCVCGNGLQPNVSEYSLTLPFFVCQEWGNQCVQKCGDNNPDCTSACRQDHPCGAQNPTRVNASSTASGDSASATDSAAAASSSAGQVFSGFGGGDATTTASGSSKTGSSDSDSTATTTGGSTAATTEGGSLQASASATSAATAVQAFDNSRVMVMMATMGGLVAGFAMLL